MRLFAIQKARPNRRLRSEFRGSQRTAERGHARGTASRPREISPGCRLVISGYVGLPEGGWLTAGLLAGSCIEPGWGSCRASNRSRPCPSPPDPACRPHMDVGWSARPSRDRPPRRRPPSRAAQPAAADHLDSGAVISDVVVGDGHVCAVSTLGAVWCWGDNTYGQLGRGSDVENDWRPALVPGLSQVSALAAGAHHTCAVFGDEEQVACWGRNDSGQLGDGTTRQSEVPVVSDGVSSATMVGAGRARTRAPFAACSPSKRCGAGERTVSVSSGWGQLPTRTCGTHVLRGRARTRQRRLRRSGQGVHQHCERPGLRVRPGWQHRAGVGGRERGCPGGRHCTHRRRRRMGG